MYKTISIVSAILLTAFSVSADADVTVGDISVLDPYAFETSRSAMAAGGYLVIRNTGNDTDRLMGVEADFPRVMIHSSEEKDGVARMVHVETLEIPPGSEVVLAPGGLHVMFMGLRGDPFEAGEQVPAVLVFERAGRVGVTFEIRTRNTSGN